MKTASATPLISSPPLWLRLLLTLPLITPLIFPAAQAADRVQDKQTATHQTQSTASQTPPVGADDSRNIR